MDKEKICILPPQTLQSFQYLRAIKGVEYACDFISDILKYGMYGIPIENSYPEIDLEELAEQMDELKNSFLRTKKGGRKSTLDDDKIKELYENGLSIIQIAKQLSCSVSTIKRHLSKIITELNND